MRKRGRRRWKGLNHLVDRRLESVGVSLVDAEVVVDVVRTEVLSRGGLGTGVLQSALRREVDVVAVAGEHAAREAVLLAGQEVAVGLRGGAVRGRAGGRALEQNGIEPVDAGERGVDVGVEPLTGRAPCGADLVRATEGADAGSRAAAYPDRI